MQLKVTPDLEVVRVCSSLDVLFVVVVIVVTIVTALWPLIAFHSSASAVIGLILGTMIVVLAS